MIQKYREFKDKIEKLGVHDQLGPTGSGWWIEQNPAELASLLCKLESLGMVGGDDSKVLEIGTAVGGLYKFFRNIMKWNVYVIDIREPQSCHLKDHYCVARSDSDKAVRWATANGPFNMVFIDADHSYNAVKKDYELYSPMAEQIVVMHDICGLRDCAGAKNFYDELEAEAIATNKFICGKAIAQNDQRAGLGWVI